VIGIINYGLGNIAAFSNVYSSLSIPHQICSNKADLKGITKLIIPGVGAFDYAMGQLINSGMKEELDTMVLERKIPILGVCVGMQMLAKWSEEGSLPGLGWIDGTVRKFQDSQIPHKAPLPHMGWNNILHRDGHPLFAGLDEKKRFYFLHSYYFECADEEDIVATSDYGKRFSCAVNNKNIQGVQFHPEKSHSNGTQLLKNFAMNK
jgi:imidazole glycerol-phosphate synthase subunit HisH